MTTWKKHVLFVHRVNKNSCMMAIQEFTIIILKKKD